MPILLSDGYQEKGALGLVTSAGSLGLLFPPCLPLILYAIIAKVPLCMIMSRQLRASCSPVAF